jgi:hypothetical protein
VAWYAYPETVPSLFFLVTARQLKVVVIAVKSSVDPPPRGSQEV